jgi:chemotaxis response regulator CheB
MSHIRVLVAGMPVLHADIIRRIVGAQPDISIVGEIGAGGPDHDAVQRADPDVVLVATAAADPACACLGVVWEHPWLRVLTLDVAGLQGSFVESRLRRGREVWPDSLVEAIRHAAAPDDDLGQPLAGRAGPS